MTEPLRSAVYQGWVRHRRFGSPERRFRYPLALMYLDLQELPRVFEGSALWSYERPNVAWFRRADYLGDPAVPLEEAVRARAEEQSGVRPSGPVRMLTQVRQLGVCFNPVTLYYCFDREGESLEALVAEVTNTPWGERHSYTLLPESEPLRAVHQKAFHVSPLLGMDADYRWVATTPGERLAVHIEVQGAEGRRFDATLGLARRELTPRTLRGTLARWPATSAMVLAAIYWEAARTLASGGRFHPHPNGRPDPVVTQL